MARRFSQSENRHRLPYPLFTIPILRMYHIYTTEAIVIGSAPRGETSMMVRLLTPEMGLIYAHAQAIRAPQAKLRAALQDFTYTRADLVRGKGGWRVIGARALAGMTPLFRDEARREAGGLAARLALLVRRLVRGEAPNEALFYELMRAYALLREGTAGTSPETLASFEALVVMRMLRSLGYWADDAAFQPFITAECLDDKLLDTAHTIRPRAIAEINRVLGAIQL